MDACFKKIVQKSAWQLDPTTHGLADVIGILHAHVEAALPKACPSLPDIDQLKGADSFVIGFHGYCGDRQVGKGGFLLY